MIPLVAPLAASIDLDTDLFLNCIEGVSEVDARHRITPSTNNMAFVAMHLVDARYFLARLVKLDAPSPFDDHVHSARSIDDIGELPSLDTLRSRWTAITPDLLMRMGQLVREDLTIESPQPFPIDDTTVLGGIAFMIHHEAYHIGQLGILRRQLGYPAMAYTRAFEERKV